MSKRVYRVTADFKVSAEFDVIAENQGDAEDLVAGQSVEVHERSIRYAIEAGEYDVDESNVKVKDLGEATIADIERVNKVIAIRP